MTRLTKAKDQELDMDMTPMIDCVFLLMIFFVLVIDLSQKDMESLILPKAEYAIPDEDPPEVRPIINITQDGRFVYKKNEYYNPRIDGDNFARAGELLTLWKDSVVTDVEQLVIGGKTITLVNDPVLIRADKWTEWFYVGRFMAACSQPDAAFWKLELAASEEDKELRQLKSEGRR